MLVKRTGLQAVQHLYEPLDKMCEFSYPSFVWKDENSRLLRVRVAMLRIFENVRVGFP